MSHSNIKSYKFIAANNKSPNLRSQHHSASTKSTTEDEGISHKSFQNKKPISKTFSTPSESSQMTLKEQNMNFQRSPNSPKTNIHHQPIGPKSPLCRGFSSPHRPNNNNAALNDGTNNNSWRNGNDQSRATFNDNFSREQFGMGSTGSGQHVSPNQRYNHNSGNSGPVMPPRNTIQKGYQSIGNSTNLHSTDSNSLETQVHKKMGAPAQILPPIWHTQNRHNPSHQAMNQRNGYRREGHTQHGHYNYNKFNENGIIPHQKYSDAKVVRFLIPAKAAGAVIGKAGLNIKELREQFKAHIAIPDAPAPERVVKVVFFCGETFFF